MLNSQQIQHITEPLEARGRGLHSPVPKRWPTEETSAAELLQNSALHCTTKVTATARRQGRVAVHDELDCWTACSVKKEGRAATTMKDGTAESRKRR